VPATRARLRVHTSARVEYGALVEALEEDVAALASGFSAEQKQRLGLDTARTPLTEAMWDEDPDHIAWKKSELERARQLAGWSVNPEQVAQEARDFRS
jgi:hypothetical protein